MPLVKEQIAVAFVNGDHALAVQLLSHVESLKDVRAQSFLFPFVDNEHNNVPLLSLAAWHGWLDIASELTIHYKCDPRSTDSDLATPLHYAARGGHLDVVKFLSIECKCDLMAASSDGSTPLHYACQYGNLLIAKYFIEEHHCNPECSKEIGVTPLHCACLYGHMDTVKYLIEEQKCNPSCQTNNGSTPLCCAAGHGKTEIVKYLITKHQCDPQHKNNFREQPLHWACQNGHMDTVKYLIEEQKCNPSCQDKEGNTPLHFAAGYGHTEIVEYLITKHQCDPQHKSKFATQPLHWACRNGHIDTVKYLIEEHQCDPAHPNISKSTPLYWAFHKNNFNIVEYIVTRNHCKINAKLDKDENTIVHLAAKNGYVNIVKFLSSMEGFDVSVENINGSHPLHFACQSGHVKVVQFFLSQRKAKSKKQNKFGFTPMMLAANSRNSSELLSLFAFFGHSKSSVQVHEFVKVGILGPSGAGKTTLSAVIAEQGKADLSSRYRIFLSQCVPEVEGCTAGIIPSIVKSKKFGNIIIHDFAGHSEYYSSHTAILETLCCSSSAVIIIVIDVSKSDPIGRLQYWLTFIKNEIQKATGEVRIIVVGSHIDMIDRDLQSSIQLEMDKKASAMIETIGSKYVGYVSLDCRKLWSKELVVFGDMLHISCEEIQRKSNFKDISIYCHILYLFLVGKTQTRYCTLSHLKMLIGHDTSSYLPTENSELSSHLITLHDIGLVFFIVSKSDIDQSWIIAQKEFILSEVNGVLFAPRTFKQCRNIVSNTGLVTESVLEQHFPHYNSQMLTSFLVKMELCQELESSVLQLVINNLITVRDDGPSEVGNILFFPALVDVERSFEITGVFHFGLCLRCRKSFQFSTRFLHVLLLHLAYKHALPSKVEHRSNESSLPEGIFRKCYVWKNGIMWTNGSSIKTVVEVSNDCKTLLLVMSQESDSVSATTFAQLRGELVTKILDLLEDFCPSVEFDGSLLHPKQLRSYPSDTEFLTIFSVTEMFESFMKGGTNVVNATGSEALEFVNIFPKEPYFSIHPFHVKQLFDDNNNSKAIPRALSHHIQSRCGQLYSEGATYESVRMLLDKMSIFGGRNPFLVAGVDPDSVPPLPHDMSTQTLTVDDLSELMCVLEDVTDWRLLGLHLGIKVAALETVDYDCKKLLDAKREMLKVWLKQDSQVTAAGSGVTWKSLATALTKMQHNVVAKMIEEDYLDSFREQDSIEGTALPTSQPAPESAEGGHSSQ